MQPPEQVLAARIPSGAKTVLTAMWRAADSDPPWTPALYKDLARASGLSLRQVKRWIAFLRQIDAIRPESRQLLGRTFEGHGLVRTVRPPPLQRRSPASPATVMDDTSAVVKREEAHAPPGDRIEADLAQIARHAYAGDSVEVILERLLKARAPCSDLTVSEVDGTVERVTSTDVVVQPRLGGEPRTYALPRGLKPCVKAGDRVRVGQQLVDGRWHKVKVFRRVEVMAAQLGVKGQGMRAGDIVQRWKRTRESLHANTSPGTLERTTATSVPARSFLVAARTCRHQAGAPEPTQSTSSTSAGTRRGGAGGGVGTAAVAAGGGATGAGGAATGAGAGTTCGATGSGAATATVEGATAGGGEPERASARYPSASTPVPTMPIRKPTANC